MKFENKVRATYKLCRVLSTMKSQEDIVWIVTVMMLSTRGSKGCTYNPTLHNEKMITVQHLVLITPLEELPTQDDDILNII